MNKQRKMLRERLLRSEILVLPGVYDALTAKIAAEVGFDALVMGGYSIAASRLGQPDVGYLSMTEMVQAVKCIVDATELPVFADGDTGYGNALSVRRTKPAAKMVFSRSTKKLLPISMVVSAVSGQRLLPMLTQYMTVLSLSN